jgi:hypothetical protein
LKTAINGDFFFSAKPKRFPRNVGFSLKKRRYYVTKISRSKTDFDPRSAPIENIDFPIAGYIGFFFQNISE